MTPEDYEFRKCHQSMCVPDGMDPLDEDVRFCESCAIDEIERLGLIAKLACAGQEQLQAELAKAEAENDRLQAILSTPPTWLCPDCQSQWIIRDEAEKQPAPVFTDNRDAKPLPPRQGPNGQLRCPGQNCANILNKHTPRRCPDCLRPLFGWELVER
jgi:hypothetical protein